MSGGRISRVLSVCEKKDIGTWRHASRAVMRHIEAEDYLLLCPDNQLGDFRAATAAGWRVEGESRYAGNCSMRMIRQRVSGANKGRENWLFQQFLKINAILMSGLRDGEVMLIWDADTIPLRRLDFTRGEALLCYAGREIHTPYFETMEKLLGFGKRCEPSFIAQCMPLKVGWAQAMVAEIEGRFGVPYPEAALSVLPGLSGSEFSEYETLGNWSMEHFPDDLELRKRGRWLRDGLFFTGADLDSLRARAVMAFLRLFFDYIAVENWSGDRFRIGTLAKRMGSRLRR